MLLGGKEFPIYTSNKGTVHDPYSRRSVRARSSDEDAARLQSGAIHHYTRLTYRKKSCPSRPIGIFLYKLEIFHHNSIGNLTRPGIEHAHIGTAA